MLDPVTGIGLVAAVIQLVQFGITTAQTCHELYEKGSTESLNDLDYTANHLVTLSNSLEQSMRSVYSGSAVTSRDERELVDVAHKCEECAKKLQHELQKLQGRPRGSRTEAFRKTIRMTFKKSIIDKLQRQLQVYRSLLETSLLHRLSRCFDLQSLINKDEFAKLDRHVRAIAESLARSNTSLDLLVRETSADTQKLIVRLNDLQITSQRYDEVIRSLFFKEITSRQEQILDTFDGIEDSYDWIFNEPPAIDPADNEAHRPGLTRTWSDFSVWLRSGNGVYWINGKAGSGKSTLMSRICDHEQTQKDLEIWAEGKQLLRPTFFFWSAGVREQKTISGLLRSLLYQILTRCRHLVPLIEDQALQHPLTEARLLLLLNSVLVQSPVLLAVCLFIDGLDEFEGQYEAVVKTITTLSSQGNAKICLSSRPLHTFESAFQDTPSLRLQDFNFKSIRAYVECLLLDRINQRFADSKASRKRALELVTQLVRRAEGVFLWAVIATRDIRDGLQDFATWMELEAAIDSLPPGIEDLYASILSRIKPVYRQEAIRLLLLILCSSELSGGHTLYLVLLSFMDRERTSVDEELSPKPLGEEDIIEYCLGLKSRLLSHTLGLIDLGPPDESHHYDYSHSDEDHQILFTRVMFHHRSAQDFLLQSIERGILESYHAPAEAQICYSVARGHLFNILHFVIPRFRHKLGVAERTILYGLSWSLRALVFVEELTGFAQAKLLGSRQINIILDLIKDKDILESFPGGPWFNGADIVGWAARHGMLRFVCHILDLAPTMGSLATNKIQCRSSLSERNFSCPIILLDPTRRPQADSSTYRSDLGSCLRWEATEPQGAADRVLTHCGALLETYVLSFIRLANAQTLISVLLEAGADPMVEIWAVARRSEPNEPPPSDEAKLDVSALGGPRRGAPGPTKDCESGDGQEHQNGENRTPRSCSPASMTICPEANRSYNEKQEGQECPFKAYEETKEECQMKAETEEDSGMEKQKHRTIVRESFWKWWCRLLSLLFGLKELDGNHSGYHTRYPSRVKDPRWTRVSLWHTSKLLIWSGGNLNFQIRSIWPLGLSDLGVSHCYPLASSRAFSLDVSTWQRFSVVIDCTAMFWFELCFNRFPDFQEFAQAAMNSSSRSRRTLVGVRHLDAKAVGPLKEDDIALFDERDQQTLWPLLEKWEDQDSDVVTDEFCAFRDAIKRVWAREFPERYAEILEEENALSDEEDSSTAEESNLDSSASDDL